jgi:quinol monooxygenase YgiN
MSVVQTYILRAADGKADALADVCERMAAMVRPLPGCEAVSVLRDMKDGSRFIFLETFVDAAAHKATQTMVPAEVLQELSSYLDGKPDALTCAEVYRA